MSITKHWLARPHGIQARFFLALALFVALFMTLLGVAIFLNQLHLTEKRLTQETQDLTRLLLEKANASAALLARIAPPGILSYDYLLLEGYVEEVSANSDIVYAVIFNPAGEPITHFLKRTAPYFKQLNLLPAPGNFSAVLNILRKDPSLLIARRSIEYAGGTLGAVEVGLSRTRIEQRTEQIKASLYNELLHITLITAGLIFISLVALIFLIERTFRRMVVRPIQSLTKQMARVRAGDFSAHTPVLRDDEIGLLSTSFNHMADDLRAQLTKIEDQRRTYKETRDYLANILDNSADMIATTGLDGLIVEFNSGAERTLGFKRDEVIGKACSMIYSDCAELNRLYGVVHSGTPVQNAEARLIRKDGTAIDAEVTLSPLHNNAGQLIGAVCIGRDVTQAKAIRDELIQAEKMASIGQIASWITHQIRNYLGRILMNAYTLQPIAEKAGAGKAQRDMLDAIHEMDKMVTDFLDYSRNMKLHYAPLKLDVSLDGLLLPLQAECNNMISIERSFASDLPLVYGDVFKLEQAFTNVFKNAIEVMPEGGKLRITTLFGQQKGYVVVMIEDTGPGIAPENIENVLRPFFTTKPRGTGLGLAMAARIMEAHGGTIQVSSTPGQGAKFEFIFPFSRRRNRND